MTNYTRFTTMPPENMLVSPREWIESSSQSIIRQYHNDGSIIFKEGTTDKDAKYKTLSQVYAVIHKDDGYSTPIPLLKEPQEIKHGFEGVLELEHDVKLFVKHSHFGKTFQCESNTYLMIFVVLNN